MDSPTAIVGSPHHNTMKIFKSNLINKKGEIYIEQIWVMVTMIGVFFLLSSYLENKQANQHDSKFNTYISWEIDNFSRIISHNGSYSSADKHRLQDSLESIASKEDEFEVFIETNEKERKIAVDVIYKTNFNNEMIEKYRYYHIIDDLNIKN